MIAAYLPSRQNHVGAYNKACALYVLSLRDCETGLYWILVCIGYFRGSWELVLTFLSCGLGAEGSGLHIRISRCTQVIKY